MQAAVWANSYSLKTKKDSKDRQILLPPHPHPFGWIKLQSVCMLRPAPVRCEENPETVETTESRPAVQGLIQAATDQHPAIEVVIVSILHAVDECGAVLDGSATVQSRCLLQKSKVLFPGFFTLLKCLVRLYKKKSCWLTPTMAADNGSPSHIFWPHASSESRLKRTKFLAQDEAIVRMLKLKC